MRLETGFTSEGCWFRKTSDKVCEVRKIYIKTCMLRATNEYGRGTSDCWCGINGRSFRTLALLHWTESECVAPTGSGSTDTM